MELRKLSVVLLALLLAGMTIVPMVSAENTTMGGKKYLTPEEMKIAPVHEPVLFDTLLAADKSTIPELNKKKLEFIYAVIPQNIVGRTTEGLDTGLVAVTIPKSSLKIVAQQAGIPAAIPEISQDESKQLEGPLTIIWMPKNMAILTDNGNSVTLTLPENILMDFNTLKEARTAIAASQAEKIQIDRDTVVSYQDNENIRAVRSEDFQERSWYYDNNCAHQINGVTGKIDPSSSYNNGESYFSYHEMELYLQRDTDCVEFISYHRTDNQVRAFVSMHDDYVLSTPLDIDVTGISYVEYYFYIEDDNGVTYWMHFRNPSTGSWDNASWSDTDNPSYYVKSLRGSTELSLDHVPPLYSFRTATSPISVDWTRTTSGWETPKQTTVWRGYTPDMQYVDHVAAWNTYDGIDTSQVCGSGVS